MFWKVTLSKLPEMIIRQFTRGLGLQALLPGLVLRKSPDTRRLAPSCGSSLRQLGLEQIGARTDAVHVHLITQMACVIRTRIVARYGNIVRSCGKKHRLAAAMPSPQGARSWFSMQRALLPKIINSTIRNRDFV